MTSSTNRIPKNAGAGGPGGAEHLAAAGWRAGDWDIAQSAREGASLRASRASATAVPQARRQTCRRVLFRQSRFDTTSFTLDPVIQSTAVDWRRNPSDVAMAILPVLSNIAGPPACHLFNAKVSISPRLNLIVGALGCPAWRRAQEVMGPVEAERRSSPALSRSRADLRRTRLRQAGQLACCRGEHLSSVANAP